MSEMTIEGALRSAADELHRRHQRFALVGGLAIAIRGEVRFTRDIAIVEQEARPKDRSDAVSLLAINPRMDLKAVRTLLDQIAQRGLHRHQDLSAKLQSLLSA